MIKFDFNELRSEGNMLIVGCGGGFDAGSALPLRMYLNRTIAKNRQVFLGGVQEPAVENFMNSKCVGNPYLSGICWLTPETRLAPNGADHPILTVRQCPELCISRSLGIPVAYLSASEEKRKMLNELLVFCKESDIQSIFAVDTGIDSHVHQGSQGNLGDPEIDCWTRDLLMEASDHHIECYLVNVCICVETWISKDIQESFKKELGGSPFRGIWSPTAEDVAEFFKAWQYSKRLLGFEPSNTGYVLHQALSGIRGRVRLPHSRGISVKVTKSTADYYLFELNKMKFSKQPH